MIVPVYNRAGLVGRALDSILSQTYHPIEILAVDDGSTDDSKQILEDYARRHPGVIKVLTQGNSGPAAARNHGIRHAQGEFIAFLDSDDMWVPTKLERQVPLCRQGPGLVYSAIQEVDEEGRLLRTVPCEDGLRGDIYRDLLIRNRMTGGTVVVRRASLERVGLFDESLQAAENWDLWIRIGRDFEVDFVDEPLVKYLRHEGSMSEDLTRMRHAAEAVLRKHFPDPPSPEDPIFDTYNEAFAHFNYRVAVRLFTAGNLAQAREMIRRCWRHRPGYRDTRIRYLRTFLGSRLNSSLSVLKRVIAPR